MSFTQPGRFSATLLVGADGLITQVDSVFADPVLGDTKAVTTYSDYRDFGGVKFPMRVRQTMGGYPVLDLAVTAVEVNPAASFDVPEAARNQAERVVVERLGAGVWLVGGGSHNSVAIEMADHLVLVEAPLTDARTLAVIEQVKTLAPGKPIRYVVNSHGHFDHSGGVRAAVGGRGDGGHRRRQRALLRARLRDRERGAARPDGAGRQGSEVRPRRATSWRWPTPCARSSSTPSPARRMRRAS